ncbi:hypothetical protein ABZ593_05605 [Streptomyces sp. NPDC012617]|uniref:hypothetical protein n=1 Tax=Streptomyces TaxID=1883 RepID=UPI0033E170CE
MAVQNSTVEPPALHVPALSPAEVAAFLTVLAETLRQEPARILTGARLTSLVLDQSAASPTEASLLPVWQALPAGPDGDEYAEYAARIQLVIRDLAQER